MRQLSIILLVIFIFCTLTFPAESAYKGGITYSIPIEYKNLSEAELNTKAKTYFISSQPAKDGVVSDETTNALVLYSILQNINPENADYSIKLGILYDKIGKDRFARGNFAHAIGIAPDKPEPYFYYGEYYYKRGQYRQALRYYKKAFDNSLNPSYDMCYKLGDVYEKFGDTQNAIKYLRKAYSQSSNKELGEKIKQIELSDKVNKIYYKH